VSSGELLLVIVLVLAGVELIFFVVAGTGLYFGFVLETVWITAGCLSDCWAVLTQSQGPSCSSRCPTSEEGGGAEGAGGTHSRDSWPQLTEGVFCAVCRRAQQ